MNEAMSARIEGYRTLNDALYANREGESGIGYIQTGDAEAWVSYRNLFTRAVAQLHRLQGHGLQRRDQLIVLLNDNTRFIELFWACQLGGIVPVPVAPGISDEHRHKLFRIFAQLERPHLYTDEDMLNRLAAFELSENPEQLVAVLVADAGGDRHRHDPAQLTGPENLDETLIIVQQNDQLIAALQAVTLQPVKLSARACKQIAVTDPRLGVARLNVADAAVALAIGVKRVVERPVTFN